MKKIVLFGAGQIAELCHFYFSRLPGHQVAGFAVDDAFLKETTFQGLPVVPYSKIKHEFPPADFHAFSALSYSEMNRDRQRAYDKLKKDGYRLATYLSPHCTNFASKIGENCLILEDNTLQPFCEIGNNVVLWSGNHIGHHSKIGDHSFVTSHVVISGGVTIGESCFLGVNATLRDHITIGDQAFISAGALITADVKSHELWKGPKATLSTKPTTEVSKP